jgi:hypothetical protein
MLRKKKDPLEIELYDLSADISESRNLAAEQPSVVAKIRKLMTEEHTPSKHFPMRPID